MMSFSATPILKCLFFIIKSQSQYVQKLSFSFFRDGSKSDTSVQGIPPQAEVPPVAPAPASGQEVNPSVQAPQPAQPTVTASGPNANPLDLFPQVLNLHANCIYFNIIIT